MELYEYIAFELHEIWRSTRKNDYGTYKPYWQKVTDKAFIKKAMAGDISGYYVRLNGADIEIDIANASYNQLSLDHQEENKQAAIVALDICKRQKFKILKPDEIGSIIHSAWLQRNPQAKTSSLRAPYKDLPKEEQDKYMAQFKIAFDMSSAMAFNAPNGSHLDDVIQVLAKAKKHNINSCMVFNNKRLFSLYDTPDTCYLKVTGMTKSQYKKPLEDLCITDDEKNEKANAQIPVWYERGKPMIYPQKWDSWLECVKVRASDLYHGWELESALDIMEALDTGVKIEEVSKIFKNQGHSGMSAGMTLNILANFSKRGVEFFRANCTEKITKETEKYLEDITKENAKFERELQKNLATQENTK